MSKFSEGNSNGGKAIQSAVFFVERNDMIIFCGWASKRVHVLHKIVIQNLK